MVDTQRLVALVDRLKGETAQLRRLAGYPPDEILTDADRVASVKYRFVVAIEICIDAGQHIISSEGLRVPKDFADVFVVLAETGFVSQGMVPTLQEMARFRNLLVHGYADVDDRLVVEILRSRLDDFDAFRVEVARAALK